LTLNVVVFDAPIKGAAAQKAGGLALEQRIGRASVLLGSGDMGFDARNFGLKRLDSLAKLGDRKGAEILTDQQGQRIGRAAGEKIVVVHRD
jgi:hypothetical protein